ncbi:lipase secretion chaperone [Pseudomonas sp. B392_1p]|uniref:lipase secretion chaperone n=1 Tax=Pseudomonas sp. B392_1p TaxID=3457507 RepID=UPI003FD09F61
MNKTLLLMVPLALVATFVALPYLLPSPVQDLTVAPAPATQAPKVAAHLAIPSTQATPAEMVSAGRVLATLPPSFSGTDVDGEFRVDANGQLILSDDIRRIFDYFLAATGEEPLSTSIERLQAYIASQLVSPARERALELLAQYLDYKTQVATLEQNQTALTSLDALRQRELNVQALRTGIFGHEAHQAFFGREEGYNLFTLQRLAIQNDPSLSSEAKGQAIDQLRASLPEELQDAVLPQLQNELSQRTAELQRAGANPRQIRQLRQQLVGAEATARLETLDQQRQAWNQRLQDYLSEKAKIDSHTGLAAGDKAAAIARLAEERFNANERLRLEGAEQVLLARKAAAEE